MLGKRAAGDEGDGDDRPHVRYPGAIIASLSAASADSLA
jgi:hypothetical protein